MIARETVAAFFDELQHIKLAESTTKKYLPWGTAAGLGVLGEHAGRAAGVKGRAAGAALGAVTGAVGGDILGAKLGAVATTRRKRQGEEVEGPSPSTLKRTILSNALGLSAGTAAGYGTGKLIEMGAKKMGVPPGRVWPTVLKGSTTAMGVAYPMWRMHEQRVMSGRKRKK